MKRLVKAKKSEAKAVKKEVKKIEEKKKETIECVKCNHAIYKRKGKNIGYQHTNQYRFMSMLHCATLVNVEGSNEPIEPTESCNCTTPLKPEKCLECKKEPQAYQLGSVAMGLCQKCLEKRLKKSVENINTMTRGWTMSTPTSYGTVTRGRI